MAIEPSSARLQRIRETLYPTRDGYCSEPIDIDDACWLLAEVDRLTNRPAQILAPRTSLDVVGTNNCKATTTKVT